MMEKKELIERLKNSIRDVPDFPKKGIVFKDITTLLKDGRKFKEAIDCIVERYKGKKIDKVVAIEARGFVLGSVVAYRLGAGIVPVRKKGKLPYKTNSVEYELEYGKDSLEMHKDAIEPGDKVLVVDDLLATGGTMNAVCDLIERSKGEVIEAAFLIELDFLKGRDRLKGRKIFSLIKF